MLVVFTVNFCVICHCAANAAPKAVHCHSCCEKKDDKSGGSNHNGCSGMQAVKFNLLEKQVSSPVSSGEQPVALISPLYHLLAPVKLPANSDHGISDQWAYKHAPPDLQALYQRFLI